MKDPGHPVFNAIVGRWVFSIIKNTKTSAERLLAHQPMLSDARRYANRIKNGECPLQTKDDPVCGTDQLTQTRLSPPHTT